MSNERIVEFSKCLVRLQASNPPEYERFMTLLTARLDEVTETLVSSPPEQLQTNQGRALEIRALFKEVHEAPTLVAKLMEKQRGQQPAQR